MTKTFNKNNVYSWSNAEDAKKYIGTFGYFSNVCFDNLKEWEYGELEQINPNNYISGIFSENHGSDYGLFLPEDKVKEVEEVKEKKKYRPFTLEEFNKVVPLGTVFKYRYKSNDDHLKDVYSIYYHANLDCENGFQAIFFEDSYHHFDYCFYEMELFLNGKWQPFGVMFR